MNDKLALKAFDSIFKISYEPLYVGHNNVGKENAGQKKKNTYETIYSALLQANNNALIKINEGLYKQKIDLNIPNLKIQSNQPSTKVILANDQFATVTVDLPSPEDQVFLEGIKFAHICQHSKHFISWPSLKELKEVQYMKLKVGSNINTNIIVKNGTLQLDECRISLATQKDPTKLVPCIIVEEGGTLVMNRCEIIGGVGTVGIYCRGGKLNIRETNIKDHGGVGILVTGLKTTRVIIKNSVITKCTEGVVLNGPFCSSIENNIITQCSELGVMTLCGNLSNITNNQFKQCKVGLVIQSSCPKVMKNTFDRNIEYGISIIAKMNMKNWPLIKFNSVTENKNGGIFISGVNNKAQIFNNVIKYNNKFGVRVEQGSNPHIFLNDIINNIGNGIHICTSATAFIEKNNIIGSINCNVIIEGPNNIDNYVYNNKIKKARGNGVFVINCQKFLIAKNQIQQNYNGILSVTSVVTLEENQIQQNKCNGVMLLDDNQLQIYQNNIHKNKMAGIVIRDTSRAKISGNTFHNNKIQMVIQNHDNCMRDLEEKNMFDQGNAYDIRIPKNYSCEVM